MSDLAALHAVVYGHVQGVYFRAFVEEQAGSLGMTGYVCNLAGGKAVEVWAEGDKKKLEELVKYLNMGPPGARVDKVNAEWLEHTGKYRDFTIAYH
jgi:acylphosphatase